MGKEEEKGWGREPHGQKGRKESAAVIHLPFAISFRRLEPAWRAVAQEPSIRAVCT